MTWDPIAECVRFLRRFIVLGEDELVTAALWTIHTHALDAAYATPYLWVTSPEKECGKTQLLETLDLLVARAWLTGRTSAAALARKIDSDRATLLLDESDTAFSADKEYAEALRGILNTGYKASGRYSICIKAGGDWQVKDLSTFSAKAVAGIGNGLPDTVQSRSIPLRLKRRTSAETIEPFRIRDVAADAEPLHLNLAAWAEEHLDELHAARPETPDGLGDRARRRMGTSSRGRGPRRR